MIILRADATSPDHALESFSRRPARRHDNDATDYREQRPRAVITQSNDTRAFFVRQHYIDFLNREPDPAGLAYWTNNIAACGTNISCRAAKREDTSAAFFLSIEFQETGFYALRFYRASFNRYASPPNVDGALETARRTIRDANRASEVITRLRALFNSKETATESVDLNEATREVIALSLRGLQRNEVVVRAELADNLPPVTGDRIQLQQVVLNLLRNGSEAMSTVDDRPRHLVITTDRDQGDRVRLSVKDVGVGFEPQATDRLFEAFYTTKNDGMGIGLSVSRSIIESHHGCLWAAPNDGPGVTFSLCVPCSRESVMDTDDIRGTRISRRRMRNA